MGMKIYFLSRNSVYFLTTVVKSLSYNRVFVKSTLFIQPVVLISQSIQINFWADSVLQKESWNSPEVDPFHVWLDGVRYCGQVPEGAVHFTRNVADACFGTVSAHRGHGGQEKQEPEHPSLQVRGAVGAHAHCTQDRDFHTLSWTMERAGDADIISFISHGI